MSSVEPVVKIKLFGFDSTLVDRSAINLVEVARKYGATVKGPIPLPCKISHYIVNRSPHVDKKSREQFGVKVSKRLVLLSGLYKNAMKGLSELQLPAGVEVEVSHG